MVGSRGAREFYDEELANVIKTVHVQAAIGSPDPVTETEWLQAAADRTGFRTGSSRTPTCAIREWREYWSVTASLPTCGGCGTSPTATT